jgi:hypothetical protein
MIADFSSRHPFREIVPHTTVSLELFDSTATAQGNDFAVDDVFLGTSSSIPTITPTNTPTSTPTSIRTNTPGQVPAAIVPTLSFPMLALLALALGALGWLVSRRG